MATPTTKVIRASARATKQQPATYFTGDDGPSMRALYDVQRPSGTPRSATVRSDRAFVRRRVLLRARITPRQSQTMHMPVSADGRRRRVSLRAFTP